jgi:glycosyltransferase involved in cell wall biosynthesis
LNPEKITVVRNDPELSYIRPSKGFQPVNDTIRLVYVGSINIQDGVEHLVRIVHILTNELGYKNIRCDIIGDGDSLKRVIELSKELNLEEYLNFTGYIFDREVVRDYIEKSSICVETAPFNAANRRSTFIKIMEYMACSKPIVAFDLDETRVSVADSAILVEPMNLSEFAKAIADLIENPNLQIELGTKARRRIEDGMNWEIAANELARAYESIL